MTRREGRLEAFDNDLKALLYKHGFEALVIVDMETNERFNLQAVGEKENEEGEDLVGFGFTKDNSSPCPHCRAKEELVKRRKQQ
jgi:hypothetical protein